MITTTNNAGSLASQSAFPNGKRILDLTLIILALPILVPVFALIAASIALTSPGPVFFVQTRVGLRGRDFGMVKFRSMYQDAEVRHSEVKKMSDREGICMKVKNDPRVTPLGSILRRWSLDELPQLINVLVGDMSLVGPRPALLSEVAEYPPHAHARTEVLPGITGLWQVSGRADLGFDEMIQLDLQYAARVSVIMDIQILFRTVKAVICGKGAY